MKRNAFLMLSNCDLSRALTFLNSVFGQISSTDELFQMAVLEMIKKDCRNNSVTKGRYIQCAVQLLESPSHCVKYEAASALLKLTPSAQAVKGN